MPHLIRNSNKFIDTKFICTHVASFGKIIIYLKEIKDMIMSNDFKYITFVNSGVRLVTD